MHPSLNDALNSTSTARFSFVANHVPTCKFSMRRNKGAIPSTLTTLQYSVRSGGDFIDFMDFFQPEGRKSFFTNSNAEPVSNKLAKVNWAFVIIPTEIRTGYLELAKKRGPITQTLGVLYDHRIRYLLGRESSESNFLFLYQDCFSLHRYLSK